MEQFLFNLSEPAEEDQPATVQPNLWLPSSEQIPPILFTTAEVARWLTGWPSGRRPG